VKYLRQTELNGYYCCMLVAALNALRYHGRDTFHSTGHIWQHWVDRCDCRNVIPDVHADMLVDLGVQLREIPCTYAEVSRSIPVAIPIQTPQPYTHWALVVGAEDGIVDIANYKGHLSPEPLHTRPWDALKLREGEKAYVVEIIDDSSIPGGVHGEGVYRVGAYRPRHWMGKHPARC
jgi:hypothetical protein